MSRPTEQPQPDPPPAISPTEQTRIDERPTVPPAEPDRDIETEREDDMRERQEGTPPVVIPPPDPRR